ncbi:MAG: glucosyl-3-phosphoglycerate synthase [Spirochaetota bacterium]
MTDRSTILQNTFHNTVFENKRKLVELKENQNIRISLAFPTLNEERTIGKEILVLKTELMDRYPLVDELAIIDSGSTDRTCEVAAQLGAEVFLSSEILKQYGSFRGKGENLWKSLFVLKGDIIVWIDADISNIAPKFLYGLIGPLLYYNYLAYVKAFYERPIKSITEISPSGGGRVTEILVRPLFSLFYPELAHLIQPLSGEYAGRRSLLERLPFSVGYGVEIGHLIDIYHTSGIQSIGQVDLDRRIHRNQPVQALSKMAFGILNTFINRLEKYNEVNFMKELNKFHIALSVVDSEHSVIETEISTGERPPMVEIPEYRDKFYKNR